MTAFGISHSMISIIFIIVTLKLFSTNLAEPCITLKTFLHFGLICLEWCIIHHHWNHMWIHQHFPPLLTQILFTFLALFMMFEHSDITFSAMLSCLLLFNTVYLARQFCFPFSFIISVSLYSSLYLDWKGNESIVFIFADRYFVWIKKFFEDFSEYIEIFFKFIRSIWKDRVICVV